MRILVVEDETLLREQLVRHLKGEGFVVDAAADGEDAIFMGREHPIDLAIVDVGLPGISGIEVIRTLRDAEMKYPIMVLTARARWQEKVEGLEAGADDYMTKPFHIEELMARVRALLRRAAGVADSVVKIGPISLDPGTQDVRVEERALDLTAYEYRLLHYLMMNSGKVVSKTELTEHIYEDDSDRDSNVIEVFVGRLRKKIDPENTINPIETLRGRGYRLMRD